MDPAEKFKGVDHLVEMVAELKVSHPGVRYTAVGSGRALDRMKEHCVEHMVSFTSFAPGIEPYCARCDVFAALSQGFGIVFLDATSYGKSVIVARSGGIIDVVKDGHNCALVEFGDVKQLAGLARDADLWRRAWRQQTARP